MDVSVDVYWSRELGLSVEQLKTPGVVVVSEARGGFEGYRGVLFFKRNDTLVVSADPSVATLIDLSVDRLTPTAVDDIALLQEILGGEPRRVIGPVFQGFVTSSTFRNPPSVWEQGTADLSTVKSHLGEKCEEAEWEASGLIGVSEPIAVVFDQGTVVAAAGLRNRAERVVDPCVLTDPDHRGCGLAKELVARVTAAALSRGDLVVYQTLTSNTPAVAIARGLGFEQYATGVAMRLA